MGRYTFHKESERTYRMRPGVGSDVTSIADSTLEAFDVVVDVTTNH